MIALQTILVPTDFSDTSAVALRYGKALGEAFGAALHLLHVVQEPFAQPWAVEAYGFSLVSLQEEWVREAKTRMAEALSAEDRARYKAQVTTLLGHPVVEILKYATEQQIDLIVLGVRGRGPLNQIMMGSVAERVVRKAPCPVLTVRHPEREFIR